MLRSLGKEHLQTLTSVSNLSVNYRDPGRWNEAEELQISVMEARSRLFGDEHPDTLTAMDRLAETY